MSTAEWMETSKMAWNDLYDAAGEIGEAIDQDWVNETTTFEFPDGSIATFHAITDTISAGGM